MMQRKIMLAVASALFFSVTLLGEKTMGEPIGWMERYALAEDRQQMLDELIPGTDDFFFYHCLHYQTTGAIERSEAMLRDWLAQHRGVETPTITSMIDRQRLLTYPESPERTITYLVRRLGLNLHHSAPTTQGKRRYPSELESSRLSFAQLVHEALQQNDSLKPIGVQYLAQRFRSEKTTGIRMNLRRFLQRVDGPYVEGLDELIIKELSNRRPNEKRFGDLKAHQFLTLAELRQVAKRVPEVADNNSLVAAILQRLRPSADSDPAQDPEVQHAYLTRVETYLRSLPASYNSMKACATYQLLSANMARGDYDRELFRRYLQLPRNSPIVLSLWLERQSNRVDLSEDFMRIAMLPRIGDEIPLVRAHLERFLHDSENTKEFSKYLQPDFLRRVFAEAKLLAGVGETATWYKMLTPSEQRSIRDSVELRLSMDNPRRFPTDQPTPLKVDIKNVDELVIRIYEINTLSYYRTHRKPIDTDIDLDGLIPTHEKTLSFKHSDVQRHHEELELPEITGRGVWIVDLMGNGVRARSLIRRGWIDHVDSIGADGMTFTIIDENRNPISTAAMLVGSREFVADKKGQITLPMVVDDVSRSAIITDGQISRPVDFQHTVEEYSLHAGMHLDRTQLQSGGESIVIIRPRLMVSGTVIDPGMLQEASVKIRAKDLEGLSLTHQVTDLKLDQNGELIVPIRVPARLSNLSLTLSGKVTQLVDGKERTLSTTQQWNVAGIRRTSHTHDAFLTRDNDQYVIEVRGRNGELLPQASVVVSLTSEVRNSPIEMTLQSNHRGQVRLGKLEGIERIQYGIPSGTVHHRDLNLDQTRWADEIHAVVGHSLQLPLAGNISEVKQRFRLLERRAGSYHADHSKRMKVEDGLLKIDGLTAGDFRLMDRATGRFTTLVVVDGPAIGEVAVGRFRHRQLPPTLPLGIHSIQLDPEGLKIRLSGNTQSARVHLYASRYFDQSIPIRNLHRPLPSLTGRSVSLPRCGYVSDLRLGDEYQYVLRRRYAKKYPGVMLPQPSILLNPWESAETSNTVQMAHSGEAPVASTMLAEQESLSRTDRKASKRAGAMASDYDFLKDAGGVVANLRPDADGLVTIPRKVIEGMPILQVVVCDPATLIQRTITAPLEEIETVDQRLSKALKAEVPFSFERGVLIASPQKPLDLKSLGSSQLHIYSSVADLMKLYQSLVNDSRLSDFDELAVWHELDKPAKLQSYSRLASHELHLFLWFHDRAFFNEVVHPYLKNKHEKQFIDRWLLAEDLNVYTKLWSYNQLNAAERVLLAMRMPQLRDAIDRELREVVESQDEDYEATRRSIEMALRGSLMSSRSMQRKRAHLGKDISEGFAFGLTQRALMKGGGGSDGRRESFQMEESDKNSGEAPPMFYGRTLSDEDNLAFYRELDSTKQWAESQWDQIRTVGGPAPSSLIAANSFWSSLASFDVNSVAPSSHFLRPIENRHAALVALAMSGLPLAAGDVDLPSKPDQPYAPSHAVLVVSKRLKELKPVKEGSTVLIGQRFEPLNDSHHSKKSSQSQIEPLEFLTGVPYRGYVVVSNPNAQKKVVEVFWQLPEGSLPLSGSQVTDSRTVVLEPFAVKSIQYEFYFSAAGNFSHYPATVATEETLLAQAEEKSFTVVAEATKSDELTWEQVASNGSVEQIKTFLANTNLHEVDWMRIAHRMRDQEVYRVVIKVLNAANLPIQELWAYSLVHRDDEALQEFLSLRDDLVASVGPVLKSSLLEVDPIKQRMHELLEYAPLVRARIHRLGNQNEILNSEFSSQYQSFVRMLGFSNETGSYQKLVLAYYLLIQNRISESIDTFASVDRQRVPSKLQYDYLRAYLAMQRQQYEEAELTAKRYADHPVARWNQRFNEILSQLQQYRDLNNVEHVVSATQGKQQESIAEGSSDLSVIDREQRQANASDRQPEVILQVDRDSLRIDHRNVKEATLNFYGVDLELLFSKAPFVREDLQPMAMVRPTHTKPIEFDSPRGVERIDLDDNLRRQTLLVEVVAGASRSTALYYGGGITTYVSDSYGQLQTTDAASHRPIRGAYVKVYAKYPDGSVRFHKDGYTDLRGRFDYTSISASDAQGAIRYAILVIRDEQGATLHDVAAPQS